MCFSAFALLCDNSSAGRTIVDAMQSGCHCCRNGFAGVGLQDVDCVINKALMGCHSSFGDAWSQGEIKVAARLAAAKAWLTKVKKELLFTWPFHVAKHRVIHYNVLPCLRFFLVVAVKGPSQCFPLAVHLTALRHFFFKHASHRNTEWREKLDSSPCSAVASFSVLFWSFAAHSPAALISFNAKHRLCNNLIWP